ncbi:hypothetical protein KO481_02145 [Nocardia sp. NEAU-G5]|uniref:WXG100 family type VII secretion target n=1 Tax=Nocardia albiluteola TaxID=2842303 RepID=A0ABS6AQP4_9NOCA|nr:hypothetical protein [Nocardia albiluteola]MBU3060324.1 hypothetical protein [Nocardia albiluteola]
MTTTIGRVRGCNPRSMVGFSADLTAQSNILATEMERANRDVDSAMNHWKGGAASAASARALSHKLAANRLAKTLVTLAGHYDAYGAELDGYRTSLLYIVDHDIPFAGMAVDDEGNVTAPQQGMDSHAADLQTRVKTLLNQFADTEGKAAQAISADLRDLAEYAKSPDAAQVRPQVPDIIEGRAQLPSDPQQLHSFWETLTPAERDALWQHDHYLGNRDGLPAVDRDHYNRMTLDDELARAQAGDPAVKDSSVT